MFKQWEILSAGSSLDLDAFLSNIIVNEDGLIPAIAQQHDTGEVLMMAWMNEKSIRETLSTKQVCYWSRSRQTYWRKGESSGHQQKLIAMRADCDGDALLLLVDQKGPACHTNRRSCFFYEANETVVSVLNDVDSGL
ncbi:phosphoribosyl-AMP cyclohydrolase [Reinekea sp.]|jgi:phosphoribosyl-AMP cyclohydrolase|uniref:phosphoribosyl-AMP cyclohydrolase n=1 Tax=Reinekea sp. TaxID=1970455 RepID=UPI003989A50E